MGGLISLVNDDHVDNNLKEILVYVYLARLYCKRSTQNCTTTVDIEMKESWKVLIN